jgi:hypothetical protein
MPALAIFCYGNPGIFYFGYLAAALLTWLFYKPAKPGCCGLLRKIDAQ